MKIVMLNGQNHKGSTYNIGRMIADRVAGENDIVEFFFPKDLNHFCAGCYQCIEDMAACPYYSEKARILEAVDEADIIIVTTPTYCLHMSAPLKSFFDLTFDLWMSHRPMKSMFRKKAVIISTSAGASTKSAIKDVKDALLYMGVPEILKYGIAVQATNWESVSDSKKEKINRKVDILAKRLSNGRKPSVGIKTRFLFMIMSGMHKKGWNSSGIETDYWRENGWLDGVKPWD